MDPVCLVVNVSPLKNKAQIISEKLTKLFIIICYPGQLQKLSQKYPKS